MADRLREWLDLAATLADAALPLPLFGASFKLLNLLLPALSDEERGRLGEMVPTPVVGNAPDEQKVRWAEEAEHSFLAADVPNIDREAIADAFGYRDVHRRYSRTQTWVPPRKGSTLLAPFVEVFQNKYNLPADECLQFRRKDGELDYILPRLAAAARPDVEALVRAKDLTNDEKLHICDLEYGRNEANLPTCVLRYGRSRYWDYLLTNWAVANLPQTARWEQLRVMLLGEGELPELGLSRASNHLGVSAVLETADQQLVFARSTSSVVSSPSRLIPAASGSADWHYDYARRSPLATSDVLREAVEEQKIDYVDIASDPVLLSVCRNALRGGKPEVFFLVPIGRASHELRGASFEIEDKRIFVPALVGDSSDAASREQLLQVMYGNTFDGLVSPFARVAAYLYLRHKKAL